MMKPTDILGNIKLYNADCMEVMKTFKDKQFDLAIVDPEYGKDAANMTMGKGQNKKWVKKDWDKKAPNIEYFNELFRITKNQIIWGGNYFQLPITGGWIFWDKDRQKDISFADGELAWTNFLNNLKKITVRYDGFIGADAERIHPTQKPVKLYKRLLQNYAEEGDTILDTHFGSLSIGIACHDMKFDLTAIELDKDYYEQAKQRLIYHQRQLTLF